jgi:uncharacterized membrane protein
MPNGRISAFSDGVIAILITIMVLDLKMPLGANWSDLWAMHFNFLIYIISFVVIAIYWNNHHHVFHLVTNVTGKILWWNMALLLTLSFFPFSTAWLAHYPMQQAPEIVFGVNALLVDLAFDFLTIEIFKQQQLFTRFRDAKWSWKVIWSIVFVLLGIGITFAFALNFVTIIAVVLSLLPWTIPDRQIEKNLNQVEKN